MNIKAVVFDIAGTTVSDENYVREAFKNAFLKEGVSLSNSEIDALMGFKKQEAILQISAAQQLNWPDAKIVMVHETFVTEMKSIYQNVSLYPLPGVVETFEALTQSGIQFGFNTGFSRDITMMVFKKLGWDHSNYAQHVVCSDEVPSGRPAPFMIKALAEKFGLPNAAHILKVGDTEVDVAEGKNAGCATVVSVTTGSSSRDTLHLAKPDYIIDAMDELLPIVNTINGTGA